MADADSRQAGNFSIKVRRGDWEVEVSAPDETFVSQEIDRLIEQFKINATTIQLPTIEKVESEAANHSGSVQFRTVKQQTLNEFFRQFKLQTHLDKILVLGYWLEIKQGQPHFTSEDILTKYKEAKEQAPANVRRDLSNLVAKGFLLPSGKSEDGTLAYALTNSGIREVESKMPQA